MSPQRGVSRRLNGVVSVAALHRWCQSPPYYGVSDTGLTRGVRRLTRQGVRHRLTTWCQTAEPNAVGVSRRLTVWCQTPPYYVVSVAALLRGVSRRLTTWCQSPPYAVGIRRRFTP
ncbi:MAG: hypothetical protein LBK25_01420 [Treponema sp.]|nr:hypothetical protein [Treponema sp.]